MERRAITIKNVEKDVIEMLRGIRKEERRQLAVILADCVQSYMAEYYVTEMSDHDDESARGM